MNILSSIIICLGFVLAIFVDPLMPSVMASHWGINGEVNGYASKLFGLYFMPFMSLVLYVFFLILPKTDPYSKNFSQFKQYYQQFIAVIVLFLFYLYLLTILWNLGYRFNLVQLTSPAFSFLFYFTGVLTSNARKNWFVGIRTPWTMSSEVVWKKTHYVGSRLFKLIAAISLLGFVFPHFFFYLLVIPIILVTVFVFVYSYIVFRRQG